ncbi:hypothetical protein B0H15DRAFT_1001185 [Mycena belliarum]|uniref:Uncharacterized protein n=1 Tax=Mycena belliarum TaxID=1033014 RepID=A0AAD6TV24_9AGAR|nr:hypothetical protein B0H15DRAFT_1001185 [Mycena belliae]
MRRIELPIGARLPRAAPGALFALRGSPRPTAGMSLCVIIRSGETPFADSMYIGLAYPATIVGTAYRPDDTKLKGTESVAEPAEALETRRIELLIGARLPLAPLCSLRYETLRLVVNIFNHEHYAIDDHPLAGSPLVRSSTLHCASFWTVYRAAHTPRAHPPHPAFSHPALALEAMSKDDITAMLSAEDSRLIAALCNEVKTQNDLSWMDWIEEDPLGKSISDLWKTAAAVGFRLGKEAAGRINDELPAAFRQLAAPPPTLSATSAAAPPRPSTSKTYRLHAGTTSTARCSYASATCTTICPRDHATSTTITSPSTFIHPLPRVDFTPAIGWTAFPAPSRLGPRPVPSRPRSGARSFRMG